MISIEALREIASYAPHMLTTADRRRLRLHRWAGAIRLATYIGPAICVLAFIGMIWGMK